MLISPYQSGSKQRSVRWVDDRRLPQESKDATGRGSLVPLANNSGSNNNDLNKKRGSTGPATTAVDPAVVWAKYAQSTLMPSISQNGPQKKGKTKGNNNNVNTTGVSTTTPASTMPTPSALTPANAQGKTFPVITPTPGKNVHIPWGSGFAEVYKDPDSQYMMKLSLPCPKHESCCFCVYNKHHGPVGPVRVYFSRVRKSKLRLPVRSTKKRGSLAVGKNGKLVVEEDEEEEEAEPEKVFLKARWLTSSAPSGEVIVPEPPPTHLERFLMEKYPGMFLLENAGRSLTINTTYHPPHCSGCGMSLMTGEHSEGCKHRHSHCFHDGESSGQLKVDARTATMSKRKKRVVKNTAQDLAARYGQYFTPVTLPRLPPKAATAMSKDSLWNAAYTLGEGGNRGGGGGGGRERQLTFDSSRSPTFNLRPATFTHADLHKNYYYFNNNNQNHSSNIGTNTNNTNSFSHVTASPNWIMNHRKDPTGFLRVPMNSPKGSRGPPRVDLGTGRNLGKRKDKGSVQLPSLGVAGDKARGPAPFPERDPPVQIRLLSKRAQQE